MLLHTATINWVPSNNTSNDISVYAHAKYLQMERFANAALYCYKLYMIYSDQHLYAFVDTEI